ncbi:MAG: peptidase M61 [Flammeovirgaceae bacterium]
MKRRISIFFILTCFTYPILAQDVYQFTIDLVNVKNDMVKVELIVPKISQDEITYFIPKIVPGTYTIYDFGRFIYSFTATDRFGNALPVKSLHKNAWQIQQATQLDRITYWVEDTWDSNKDNFVFEPAGTNIESDKAYVLNTYGFAGYFEGMMRMPYELTIKKPYGFYGASSMKAVTSNAIRDVFEMENYMDLADAPIMYTNPDTSTLRVGGADILVSVYSPNKIISSKEVANYIKELLEAQKNFLGGTIPVKRYAFLIYLTDRVGGSGYQGALEHSYSSLYYLPELGDDPVMIKELIKEIKDVASHEFFHIITPLSIHSEEIHNFDFIAPKMSKHLWLYEGVVEYFSGLMQVQYQLISPKDYFDALRDKIFEANTYKQDVPFTEISEQCLDKYADEYGNVYEKGALIGLCLDLLLLDLSDGNYRLLDLIQDLSKRYGKEKPFKDDELFREIAKITQKKEVLEFFKKHVAGTKPLPLAAMFKTVGYQYIPMQKQRRITLGNVGLGFNKEQELVVTETDGMDRFGRRLGYKVGDVIVAINKEKITNMEKATAVLLRFRDHADPGKLFRVQVLRRNRKGALRKKVLKARLIGKEVTERHLLVPMRNLSLRQQNLRNSWLNIKE